MKRAIPVFVVLVGALSILLYLRLREQRLEAQRPCGGSATIEGTQADVISRLPTRVKKIHVRRGQAVKKGQVLVELDCREQEALLAQAKAGRDGARIAHKVAQASLALSRYGIKSAKSQIWMAYAAQKAAQAQKKALEVQTGAAKRASDRVQQVRLAGAVSEQKWDQTKSQVDGLEQQLNALDQNIKAAQARTSAASSAKGAAKIKTRMASINVEGAAVKVAAATATLSRAKVGVDECVLRAPQSGYVLERNYEPGEVVLPGSRILTLVDTREVKATFYLPNAELKAAKPNRKVEVRADAYPDKVFKGRISHVAAQAEFTPRNVQTREDRDRLVYAVEVRIPNPKGTLRPGMPVEITLPGTRRKP